MQRVRITRISSYTQKVGVVLARRAIMIVNMIHDVTMYNASSQSNALNRARSRIPAHAYIEKTEWILQGNLASVE